MNDKPGIHGPMANLYDVFVDWPSRLSREMPGLIAALQAASARKILDVGCGTGRHVNALLEAGFDAYGADISASMLDEAKQLTGRPQRFFQWAMGAPHTRLPGPPFDAIICMGNVWPQVTGEANVPAAAKSLHDLLKPGGLLLMGMKATAIRKASGNPYMPMLKREHEGRPIYFIRMIDFNIPPGDGGEELCEFHMIVVRGDSRSQATADLHNAHLSRVWSPQTLRETFTQAGFADIKISGKLADFSVEAVTEDVFLRALRPAAT